MIITRMLAIGTLLSLKGDPLPSRYNVYTIKRSNTLELAKIALLDKTILSIGRKVSFPD